LAFGFRARVAAVDHDRGDAARWLAIDHVASQSRHRHQVVTVITFARVSNLVLLQNGHCAGRATGSVADRDSGMSPTMLFQIQPAICSLMNTGAEKRRAWDDLNRCPQGLAGRHRPDVQTFLKSAGIPTRTVHFTRGTVVFAQGTPARAVFYIQDGGVTLSVLSRAGKEAVVAMLAPGDFFGEGCLAGQPMRMGTATTVMATSVLRIPTRQMIRMVHDHPTFSERFIAHMLARNIRIEEDLVDQLFNSSEKRLARPLLLLA
jgi:CRP-like cAMP-binding protein